MSEPLSPPDPLLGPEESGELFSVDPDPLLGPEEPPSGWELSESGESLPESLSDDSELESPFGELSGSSEEE